MRGYTEQGKLVNEAIIAKRTEPVEGVRQLQHRAELRIAGVGTWLGEWTPDFALADTELAEMKAKHQPSSPSADGISAAQAADFHAALADVQLTPLGQDVVARAKQELSHSMNMAYEG